MMDWIKRILGGSSIPSGGVRGDADGMYFYVQPHGCDEIVRVRINRNNDLSLTDDEKTYWVHKIVRGVKCRQIVELDLYFDGQRRLTRSELKDGVLVDQSAYDAWISQHASSR